MSLEHKSPIRRNNQNLNKQSNSLQRDVISASQDNPQVQKKQKQTHKTFLPDEPKAK